MHNRLLFILAFFLIPSIAFSQHLHRLLRYEYGSRQQIFFGRVLSARAEAMGKAYSMAENDVAAAWFNPAGVASLQGVQASYAHASPYYLAEKAYYRYAGLGATINRYFSVAAGKKYFNEGTELRLLDNSLVPITDEVSAADYLLTVASQPAKNLYLGASAHHLIIRSGQIKTKVNYFDMGATRKFFISRKDQNTQTLGIAASVSNFTDARIRNSNGGPPMALPMVARGGVSYQLSLHRHLLKDTLTTYHLLLQAEYQNLVNSPFLTGIRFGSEFTLLEVLSLRAGYFTEKVGDYGNPQVNKNRLRDFTYGLGLQAPLHKLTRLPVLLAFDYASLPQPSYSRTKNNWDNFRSYSVRLNVVI